MQHIYTNNSQQGATLIVVLILLILIVLAGAIAVRSSSTDLRLATASQVDALLFVAAEQPNATLEQMSKKTSLAAPTSPIGYFIDNPAVENNELLFCFRPKEIDPLSYSKAVELTADRKILVGSNKDAYCNSSKSNDYTSDRNATMVQTSFSIGTIGLGDTVLPTEVDLHGAGARSYSINVDSVSSIPSYGTASDKKVTNCFEKPLTKPSTSTQQTVSECLTEEGIPNKAVTQNYLAQYTEKAPVSSTTIK